jgi:hypothetical protein
VVGKGSLTLKDDVANDKKDVLTWKWAKGDATIVDDFGDPLMATAYDLCLYDGSGALVAKTRVPAGGLCGKPNRPKPCWKSNKPGFKYRDSIGGAGGVRAVTLKSGAQTKASIVVQAKGPGLDLPPLPVGSFPLRVQLRNTAGVCFDAEFSEPRKHDGGRFVAKR